jgi:hypothetical protein
MAMLDAPERLADLLLQAARGRELGAAGKSVVLRGLVGNYELR